MPYANIAIVLSNYCIISNRNPPALYQHINKIGYENYTQTNSDIWFFCKFCEQIDFDLAHVYGQMKEPSYLFDFVVAHKVID